MKIRCSEKICGDESPGLCLQAVAEMPKFRRDVQQDGADRPEQWFR